MHHAAPTRAASVVDEVMAGHRPAVWISNRYSARAEAMASANKPAWRISPATVAYALEAGEDLLALRLKLWLDKAFALARRLTELAASTLVRKRCLGGTFRQAV